MRKECSYCGLEWRDRDAPDIASFIIRPAPFRFPLRSTAFILVLACVYGLVRWSQIKEEKASTAFCVHRTKPGTGLRVTSSATTSGLELDMNFCP